jgi:hypothetical protein
MWLDDSGNETTRELATHALISEYEDGRLVRETIGRLDKDHGRLDGDAS